jgi:hypothetical protein
MIVRSAESARRGAFKLSTVFFEGLGKGVCQWMKRGPGYAPGKDGKGLFFSFGVIELESESETSPSWKCFIFDQATYMYSSRFFLARYQLFLCGQWTKRGSGLCARERRRVLQFFFGVIELES